MPLHRQEAIQIALLNNRLLQVSLDQLGVAEADFVQAGLFTTPSFRAFLGIPLSNGESDLGLSVFLSDLWQVPARKKMVAANVEATIREVGTVVVATAADAAVAFVRCIRRRAIVRRRRRDTRQLVGADAEREGRARPAAALATNFILAINLAYIFFLHS